MSLTAQSAAARFDAGSRARLATSANRTRFTSVAKCRSPSSSRNDLSMPRWLYNPSSRCTPPSDRLEVMVKLATGSAYGFGSPIYRDRLDTSRFSPARSSWFSRPTFKGLSPGTPVVPLVVGQGQVPPFAAVLVGPCRAPQVHAYQQTPDVGKNKIYEG